MNIISSRIGIVLFCVLTLSIHSCSQDDGNEITYDISGSWRVIFFEEEGNRITKSDDNTWPDINNGDITATFSEPDANGEGIISGITVSNQYNGNYSISEQGSIAIGPIITTLINEPEWTRYYNLSAAERYEVRNATLFIYYNNRNNVIAFERI